ncbi:MAG: ATP-binding protein [Deltaproteobacteria bacterium]|nr:MAG: ATP-binding protein [Deltaproteobacteria bacterium]
MERSSPVFPFSAIVGQEQMKQALLLSLIHPDIGGVLIRGERGTGKSTAVRALANLLPPIPVVADCPFRCDPADTGLMCHQCLQRHRQDQGFPAVRESMRVVDLPLGATEEMVLGTLNIERAVRQGEKSFEPGLLAKAHRGFLYVDEVNLLPDHLVDILLDAAAMGVNVVEREGISYSHPSKFILVGTMNPDEGELRPQLQDRFALCAAVRGIKDEDARRQVVARCLAFEKSPRQFANQWNNNEQALARHILEAQRRLADVDLPDDKLSLITRLAMVAGADGHRADIAMAKTAKAMAAFAGRNGVSKQEVIGAARLVLPHRLRLEPTEEATPLEIVEQVLEKVSEVDEDTPEEPAEKVEIKKNLDVEAH